MDFYEQLEESKRKLAPVRNTVADNGQDIQIARADGHSFSAIYKALKKSGIEVGSGYSSFRSAVKWLDENGWPHEASQLVDTPPQTAQSVFAEEHVTDTVKKADSKSAQSAEPSDFSRPDFSDTRHTSDF